MSVFFQAQVVKGHPIAQLYKHGDRIEQVQIPADNEREAPDRDQFNNAKVLQSLKKAGGTGVVRVEYKLSCKYVKRGVNPMQDLRP